MKENNHFKIFSYGGGQQSTAALVLAAQGVIEYDIFIFANVGDDSENPETLNYFKDVARPYAKKHDIKLIEIYKNTKDGSTETILNRIKNTRGSTVIPVRMSNGAPGKRSCTVDFKVRNIHSYIKKQYKKERWITGLGISIDEIHRAKTTEWQYDKYSKIYEKKEYPLIDLMLSRHQCTAIIFKAGLPIPPPSSCYFCPFHTMGEWRRLKSESPALFDQAVKVESIINEKRLAMEKDQVFLHRSCMPLNKAVGMQENFFDELDNCDSGYCMV